MDAFFVLELVVPLIAILGNCVALDGVLKGHISIAGYRRFLISLLASDLYICVVKLLNVLGDTVSLHVELGMQLHKCFGELGRSLEIAGFIAFLLNLCGMFVDHFIALSHPHQYKFLMDKWFAKVAVFLIWPAAFMIGFAAHPLRLMAHIINDNSKGVILNQPVANQTNCTTSDRSNNIYEDSYNYEEDDGDIFSDSFEEPSLMIKSGGEVQPCKTEYYNATFLVLDAVRRGLDFDGSGFQKSWCASFERTSKLWLDWVVVFLAVCAAVFLAICYGVFRRAVGRAGRTKVKLQQLTVTTFLLLGAFAFFWMPLICYELSMELIFQTHQTLLTENASENFFVIHNILQLLFVCSPLLVPVIYVARLRVVQQQIVRRYACLLPPSLRNKILADMHRNRRGSSVTELAVLALSSARPSISPRPQRPSTTIFLDLDDSKSINLGI